MSGTERALVRAMGERAEDVYDFVNWHHPAVLKGEVRRKELRESIDMSVTARLLQEIWTKRTRPSKYGTLCAKDKAVLCPTQRRVASLERTSKPTSFRTDSQSRWARPPMAPRPRFGVACRGCSIKACRARQLLRRPSDPVKIWVRTRTQAGTHKRRPAMNA